MAETDLRESLLNRIRGAKVIRSVLLVQVGWSWRILSFSETFTTGSDMIQVMGAVIPHSTEEGGFPSRNIATPSPPLPKTRAEWDSLRTEWEKSGGVDLLLEDLDTITPGRRFLYLKQRDKDKEVEQDWVSDMTAVWKKIHGTGPVEVGAVLTIEDLLEHATDRQLKKWRIEQ